MTVNKPNKSLEKENRELKQKIKLLEEKNRQLINVIDGLEAKLWD